MTEASQLVFGFDHRVGLGPEDFLVTDCNREAVAWVDHWPHWPAAAVIIYGPVGCGKTHLAHRFLHASGGRMLTLAELGDEGSAVSDPALAAPALVFDDADQQIRIAGESVLLHVYNIIAEQRRHLLLTSIAPPARWPLTRADLRSRLNAVPAVAIGPPDETLMRALMVKLLADRQLRVDDKVIEFVVSRIERTFEAARAVVARVDAMAIHHHRRIDVPFVREILREMDGTVARPR